MIRAYRPRPHSIPIYLGRWPRLDMRRSVGPSRTPLQDPGTPRDRAAFPPKHSTRNAIAFSGIGSPRSSLQMEPDPIVSAGLVTTPLPPPVLPPAPRRLRRVFILLGPLLGAFVLGTFIKGELGHFFAASWEVAVFAVLCVLG